jgi:lipoprotein-releasing system permease protein
MFQPLEAFIGLRYVRARRGRGVVSFMSGASLVGIAVGVAALIVILSIMNGLETETRTRLLNLTSHLTLMQADGGLRDWAELRQRLLELPGVTAVFPEVRLEGMLAAGSQLVPVVVQGVDPQLEAERSSLPGLVEIGSFETLEEPGRQILIGRALAINLGVSPGDRVNLMYATIERGQPRPRLIPFVVGGIFVAGITPHDTNLGIIHIREASDIRGLGGLPEGLAVQLENPVAVAAVREQLSALSLPGDLEISDWTEQHRSQFHAIRIEKTMITIIMLLIVGVAAFNIVASLMMVVTDKKKDIAILRTCGLEPRRVARVFLVQGSIIGVAGALIGTILGLLLAFNVETIVPWLEGTFGFQIMPGDVYYVTQIPSEVHFPDVAGIAVLSLGLAVLATIYPSRRAAAIAPAEALRYD